MRLPAGRQVADRSSVVLLLSSGFTNGNFRKLRIGDNCKMTLLKTLRLVIFLAVVFYFSSCLVGDTKCCEHVGASSISNRLYLERYRTFCAGVFGEITECYLTDSTSFRRKIGSYDEHESFFATLNGNKVEAYNFQSSLIADTTEKE